MKYKKGKQVESKQEFAELIAAKKPYYFNDVLRVFGSYYYDIWDTTCIEHYYHAEEVEETKEKKLYAHIIGYTVEFYTSEIGALKKHRAPEFDITYDD